MSTLLKIKKDGNIVEFRTINFNPVTKQLRKSPQRFCFLKDEFLFAESHSLGHFYSADLDSFSAVFLRKDTITIRFSWLKDSIGGLSGYVEYVQFDYARFKEFLEQDEEDSLNILVDERPKYPKLDFSNAGKVLQEVVKDKTLKKALSRALRDNFQWVGVETVEFYPETAPNSFFFRASDGLCGGLILHEDRRKGVYYSVHT